MDIQSNVADIVPYSGLSSLGSIILVVMIILIMLSAFFSMSETAFSSSSDAKLTVLVEERKRGAKKALQLQNNFDKTLITLLIGNNLVNVALSTLAVIFFSELIKSESVVSIVSTAVITIVLLIFGEIVPKIIAKQHPEAIAIRVSWIIYVLSIVLIPFVYFFLGIQKIFSRNEKEEEAPDEDELGVLIDKMEEKGELEHDEANTIRNVFDLNDRAVEDIMVPRVMMSAISYDAKLEDVKEFMLENPFSRVPVFKGDKDHIIGVLFERDFFPGIVKNPKLSWKKLIRPIKFVAGTMKVDALIEEMQKGKTHIAIVCDEYGGTLGCVTMEDALEEIVGEIYDEHDTPGDNDLKFIEKEDGSYIVDGEYFVEDLFERLNVGDVPENVPSKVNGWMFAKCESIPKVGFSFSYTALYTRQDDESDEYLDYAKVLEFTIDEVFNRRIIAVKLVIRDATEEEIEARKAEDEDD